jgi:hypothetical protein
VTAAFQLLITLVGVTFLFGCLQENGTLERVIAQALRVCGNRALLMPPTFFVLAAVTSAIGPGGILATALYRCIDPLALATSVLVEATLVDVSPLSTLGALCVAASAEGRSSTALFRALLAWGFCMSLVAAAICHFASQIFGG